MPSLFKQEGRDIRYAKAKSDCLIKSFKPEKTYVVTQVSTLKDVAYLIPVLKASGFYKVITILAEEQVAIEIPKKFYDSDYLKELKDTKVPSEIKNKFEGFNCQECLLGGKYEPMLAEGFHVVKPNGTF